MEKTNTGFIGGSAGGGKRAGFFARLKRGAAGIVANITGNLAERLANRIERKLDAPAARRSALRVRRAAVVQRRATGTRGPARKRQRPDKTARRAMTSLGVRNTATV